MDPCVGEIELQVGAAGREPAPQGVEQPFTSGVQDQVAARAACCDRLC